MKKQLFNAKFLGELDRSLVVDYRTRKYWIKNYKFLPLSAVKFFYAELLKQNKNVDMMIAAGIDANPELEKAILQRGKDAKKKFLKFLEKQTVQEENPEQFLKQNLF